MQHDHSTSSQMAARRRGKKGVSASSSSASRSSSRLATMSNLDLLSSMYRAAVKAVQPQHLIRSAVQMVTFKQESGGKQANRRVASVSVESKRKSASEPPANLRLTNRDVFVFGAGKAVLGMCQELLTLVEEFNKATTTTNRIKIKKGHLNIPTGMAVDDPGKIFSRHRIAIHQCGKNNLPDDESVLHTEELLTALKSFLTGGPADPLVIGFISGGGSALLSKPKSPVTLAEKLSIIRQLVRKGANIKELNAIRGRLSEVKRGGLARKMFSWNPQCQLATFLISDIVGDPVEMIASGPTVLMSGKSDQTPEEIIKKYSIIFDNKRVRDACLAPSPPEMVKSPKLSNIIIGNNALALEAARKVATDAGWRVSMAGSSVQCEGKELARKLVKQIKQLRITPEIRKKYKGMVYLAGGEIVLNLDDTYEMGTGGRCQELAMLVIKEILQELRPDTWKGVAALFAGTDGQDGPTPVAGVRFDMSQATALPQKEFKQSLWRHDSYRFWSDHAPDCLIRGGPTGTNVMDIYCLLCPFEGRPDSADDDDNLQTIQVQGETFKSEDFNLIINV